MKKIWLFILFSVSLLWFTCSSSWEQSPEELVWSLKSSVQQTALDNSIWWNWQWIKKTLEDVKWWSSWYIQWLWYIWLSIAIILIIYNWILILANFWEEDKLSKAKKKFLSIILWVVILTTSYVIINVVVWLIWWIFTN